MSKKLSSVLSGFRVLLHPAVQSILQPWGLHECSRVCAARTARPCQHPAQMSENDASAPGLPCASWGAPAAPRPPETGPSPEACTPPVRPLGGHVSHFAPRELSSRHPCAPHCCFRTTALTQSYLEIKEMPAPVRCVIRRTINTPSLHRHLLISDCSSPLTALRCWAQPLHPRPHGHAVTSHHGTAPGRLGPLPHDLLLASAPLSRFVSARLPQNCSEPQTANSNTPRPPGPVLLRAYSVRQQHRVLFALPGSPVTGASSFSTPFSSSVHSLLTV